MLYQHASTRVSHLSTSYFLRPWGRLFKKVLGPFEGGVQDRSSQSPSCLGHETSCPVLRVMLPAVQEVWSRHCTFTRQRIPIKPASSQRQALRLNGCIGWLLCLDLRCGLPLGLVSGCLLAGSCSSCMRSEWLQKFKPCLEVMCYRCRWA